MVRGKFNDKVAVIIDNKKEILLDIYSEGHYNSGRVLDYAINMAEEHYSEENEYKAIIIEHNKITEE